MLKQLQKLHTKISDIKGIALFEVDENEGRWQDKLNPLATQHFLAAISYLELAGIELRKAELTQKENS